MFNYFLFIFFFFAEANHDIALHFFSVPAAIYQSDSKRKLGSGFGFHTNLNHCNQKQVIFKSALLQLLSLVCQKALMRHTFTRELVLRDKGF